MTASAAVAFLATNMDAFVALSVLFATTSGPRQTRAVFASALAGFFVLLAISALGAAGLDVMPRHGVAWLGLAPVAVGVFRLYEWCRTPRHVETVASEGVTAFPGAFFLVLATGGDNVAAYVPLFHQFGVAAAAVVAAAYLAGFAALCAAALACSASAMVHRAVRRIAQPLSAALFVGIGCSVIIRGLS